MHELSIAEALFEQLRRCAPPNTFIEKARVEIGARQSIDESSLRFAWDALVASTDYKDTKLEITILPWTLTCASCKKVWNTDDPLQLCPVCDSDQTTADGSALLRLQSIEVSSEQFSAQQYL